MITRLKMAKLLYLADLMAVQEGEEPISGLKWRWLHHGPFDNSLQFLENDLVEDGVVRRDEYYLGYQIRLVGDPPDSDIDPASFALLAKTVRSYGNLAASTLKDLSYQTPPMVDAMERGKGVVLDLSLARPRPRLSGLVKRMSAVLRRLPEQENDPGVFQEVEREMDELAQARRRATGATLDDE